MKINSGRLLSSSSAENQFASHDIDLGKAKATKEEYPLYVKNLKNCQLSFIKLKQKTFHNLYGRFFYFYSKKQKNSINRT
ncbi:hypothetical protein C1631_022270 [Chryseobacterium phosphatilyticum]|uniref:Uncharacterized protein n=1 Tax=Chryseobacterium phosphatilyticum TaxID=475075 RepID=A0A316WNY8_9FLAO|nr:hypothetical protein C1631_022270 [Chryseobacterium phosphatilyticum]